MANGVNCKRYFQGVIKEKVLDKHYIVEVKRIREAWDGANGVKESEIKIGDTYMLLSFMNELHLDTLCVGCSIDFTFMENRKEGKLPLVIRAVRTDAIVNNPVKCQLDTPDDLLFEKYLEMM